MQEGAAWIAHFRQEVVVPSCPFHVESPGEKWTDGPGVSEENDGVGHGLNVGVTGKRRLKDES